MMTAEYLAIVSTTLHTIETAMNAIDAQIAFSRSLAIAVTDLYRTALEGSGCTQHEILELKKAFYEDIGHALFSGLGGWNVEYEEEGKQ